MLESVPKVHMHAKDLEPSAKQCTQSQHSLGEKSLLQSNLLNTKHFGRCFQLWISAFLD
jgi:hypothetical protein